MRAAAQSQSERRGGGSFLPLIFWIVVFVFIIISLIRRGISGRKYRGRRGRRGPVILWGPGLGSGWGSGGGSSWGGGSWGGGGGGFSGGGGSFGGGGASGGW